MPDTGRHISPGDLGFRAGGFSGPLLHLLLSVPDAACHSLFRALPGAVDSGCPSECGTGVLDSKAAPKAGVKRLHPLQPLGWAGRMGCCLLGLAAPNCRSPFHLPGIRMMSPGEQWTFHESSGGQRLGPKAGPRVSPLGETWSDTQGQDKAWPLCGALLV